jgi:predicted AlkP superfamily phosphohydrolase/phosphomutase
LEREGYLQFNTSAPKGLEEISPRSVAFVLDPNRIYLNLKKRFPKGTVADSDRKSLKEEISQRLENLEYEGKKVVRKVFDAKDIYSGPYVSEGPDLIVLSEPGFDLKGSVKKKEIFGRTNLQGMHTWEDAFFWANRQCGEDLAISDLAKVIMQNYS